VSGQVGKKVETIQGTIEDALRQRVYQRLVDGEIFLMRTSCATSVSIWFSFGCGLCFGFGRFRIALCCARIFVISIVKAGAFEYEPATQSNNTLQPVGLAVWATRYRGIGNALLNFHFGTAVGAFVMIQWHN
jgi:hypothetical protein